MMSYGMHITHSSGAVFTTLHFHRNLQTGPTSYIVLYCEAFPV
jgi:hypothetical protein